MRGSSNALLQAAEKQFPAVLAHDESRGLNTGEAIFGIADALSASGKLLRSVADPAATGASKATVLEQLLDERFSPELVAFIRGLVMERWGSDEDLIEALERLGRQAVIASISARGNLDQVEDELVAFSDSLSHADSQVQDFLAEPNVNPKERAALVDRILAHRVDPAALLLARRAALHSSGQRYLLSLQSIEDDIATHKNREIAHVISAVELTAAQKQRLEQILEKKYGHPIQVYVSLDQNIVGGLRIEVGPDVIDDTVVSRLAQARAALVA